MSELKERFQRIEDNYNTAKILEGHYHETNMEELKSEDDKLIEMIRHNSKMKLLEKEEQNEREL